MPKDILEHAGDKVRRIRESRGWTQEQLALAAGLSPPQLSRYETGTRPVTIKILHRLSKHLNAPELMDLSRFDASPTPAPARAPRPPPSAKEEAALLKAWRPLEPRSRAIVAAILKVLRRYAEK